MRRNDLEVSTFQKRPCYRYIRHADYLPPMSYAEGRGEKATAWIRLFDPATGWTCYIASYDAETRFAYGLVDGLERELGDIYMPELVEFRGRFGLPIERDLHWKPRPLAECMAL